MKPGLDVLWEQFEEWGKVVSELLGGVAVRVSKEGGATAPEFQSTKKICSVFMNSKLSVLLFFFTSVHNVTGK